MRVALIFSGRLTSCDIHHKNIIDKIVGHHSYDVFLGTHHNYEVFLGMSCEKCNDALFHKFIDLYKPKKIIESDDNIQEPLCGWENIKGNEFTKKTIKNPVRMWYNRHIIFEEVKNYLKGNFDLVVSLRCDVNYFENLNFDDLGLCLDDNTIYIPGGADYGGYQDKIAFGSPHAMEKYFNLYNNLNNLVSEKKSMNPEPLLKRHLKQTKVNVKRIEFKHQIHPKISQKQKVKNYY